MKSHSWTKSFRTPVSCPNQVLSLAENIERVEANELAVAADEEHTEEVEKQAQIGDLRVLMILPNWPETKMKGVQGSSHK